MAEFYVAENQGAPMYVQLCMAYPVAVVGKLLLLGNGVTLLPLLVKETSYF